MPDRGRISDEIYVIPFGRYTAASDVAPPANQVLVGRESQRAYLIEMLISAGRRGAFLVTGRRGAGKSSFVRHCIGEYQAAVFNRFLRANVGRGVLDRALVLFFLFLLLFASLLASELLQLIRTPAIDTPFGPIAWLVLAALSVPLFYPAVYAKLVLETLLFKRFRRRAHRPAAKDPSAESQAPAEAVSSHSAGTLSTLFVLVAVLAVWFLPFELLRSPTLCLSCLLAITAAVYLCVQALSYHEQKSLAAARTDVTVVGLISAAVLVVPSAFLPLNESFYLAAAVALAIAGLLLRFLLLRFAPGTANSRRRSPLALQEAVRSASVSYLAPALVLLLGFLFFFLSPDLETAAAVLVTLTVVIAGLFALVLLIPSPSSEESGSRFHPPPAAVLIPKALFAILIAVHLARPALDKLASFLPASLQSKWGLHLGSSWLFASRADEIRWLVVAVLLLGFLSFLEYEWILRPYEWARKHTAKKGGGPPPWAEVQGVQASELPSGEAARVHRALASLTLPWLLYRLWLPSIVVSVNLGFDRLGHSQVIQAMLVGLRDRYYRSFLAWSSGFANLGRLLGALLVLSAVTIFGRIWFEPPTRAQLDVAQAAYSSHVSRDSNRPLSTCDLLENEASLQPTRGASVICAAGELWFNLAYFNLLPTHLFSDTDSQPGSLLIHDFLPYAPAAPLPNPPLAHSGVLLAEGPYFAVYHALLFALFFFLGRWVFRRVPALPFHQNLRRIDDILDSLSARQRTTSRTDLWGPARWVYSLFTDERVRESERDPLDPRAVELAFLEVLEEIQKGGIRLPGAARHHLTIPSPEITFVFDELDKLGTRTDPDESPSLPESSRVQREVLHHERLRSIRLRSLLSDLKNILSAAPSRFIFVGGRNLHDEWLADHTARQPLLTSIFNAEVYLPSLLTDREGSEPSALTYLVRQYLLNHLARARTLYDLWALRRWRPSFGLWIENREHESFADPDTPRCAIEVYRYPLHQKAESPSKLSAPPNSPVGDGFHGDFVNFLAFRSMGNPKQLSELLTTFIVPASPRIQRADKSPSLAASRHVLEFNDHAIFRIQLVSDIYRHLVRRFHPRMVSSDDKYAVSLFFMTDFLFKFHRRAFSWSNIERVDDLANIHRLPDLPEIQTELVRHFSEQYLHRVLNGMYSFRFRSDIAREVEYISRKSPYELAALNFTLDESQSLKGLYQAALKEQGDQNADLLTGLGELYDFDQEFEPARYYYCKALDLLDRGLFTKVRGIAEPAYGESDYSVIRSVLAGEAAQDARIFLSWGTARLRLMLQIALSYERERNPERAATEYRDARTLARALVNACLPLDDDTAGLWYEDPEDYTLVPRRQRTHTLKGLHLFFQPVFAEAWLSEKVVGVVDTSASLVERSLTEIRSSLPYVRRPESPVATDPRFSPHANFLLTMSQLHNRAGDLYFFKGRQPATREALKEHIEAPEAPLEERGKVGKDRPTEGYLLRAHYHYAVAMHEIRRYVYFRVASSTRWSISPEKPLARTLLAEALPNFLYRAAAGSLNDMAEATLARVSLIGLTRYIAKPNSDASWQGDWRTLGKHCLNWMGLSDEGVRERVEESTSTAEGVPGKIHNWFGTWEAGRTEKSDRLVKFQGRDPDHVRLLMSLKLCMSGAKLFADGGYPEDAGREALQICETVTHYFWWRQCLEVLTKPAVAAQLPAEEWAGGLLSVAEYRNETWFWDDLFELGFDALLAANDYFVRSRAGRQGKSEKRGSYVIGDILPVSALTLLCSLGLASEKYCPDRLSKIKDLAESWGVSGDPSDALKASLRRHRYPMSNRLLALKVLIDDSTIRAAREDDPGRRRRHFLRAMGWTLELLELNSEFEAPLHFTPLHSGLTCAMVWMVGKLLRKRAGASSRLESIRRAAQHDLRVSEELYTMRRSYYEAIGNLYYLYDDFNDRQIHFNHAIQMAGAELAAILSYLLAGESSASTQRRRATASPAAPAPPSASPDSPPESRRSPPAR